MKLDITINILLTILSILYISLYISFIKSIIEKLFTWTNNKKKLIHILSLFSLIIVLIAPSIFLLYLAYNNFYTNDKIVMSYYEKQLNNPYHLYDNNVSIGELLLKELDSYAGNLSKCNISYFDSNGNVIFQYDQSLNDAKDKNLILERIKSNPKDFIYNIYIFKYNINPYDITINTVGIQETDNGVAYKTLEYLSENYNLALQNYYENEKINISRDYYAPNILFYAFLQVLISISSFFVFYSNSKTITKTDEKQIGQ